MLKSSQNVQNVEVLEKNVFYSEKKLEFFEKKPLTLATFLKNASRIVEMLKNFQKVFKTDFFLEKKDRLFKNIFANFQEK